MSAANFEFEAQTRDDLGKGASRRLRREDKVLGVVYGGGEAATSIMLEQRQVTKALENEAVYTHILNLKVNGKTQKVVLRDLQRHPYKTNAVLHIDFLRVNETDMLNMHVPLHFIGAEQCPGVLNGGILNHLISDVEIRCQAGKIPEHIDVDVSALELDGSIHLSQLQIAAGVEVVMLTQGHDLSVVGVHLPRQAKSEEEAEEAAAESATEAAVEASEAEATDDEKNKDHKK